MTLCVCHKNTSFIVLFVMVNISFTFSKSILLMLVARLLFCFSIEPDIALKGVRYSPLREESRHYYEDVYFVIFVLLVSVPLYKTLNSISSMVNSYFLSRNKNKESEMEQKFWTSQDFWAIQLIQRLPMTAIPASYKICISKNIFKFLLYCRLIIIFWLKNYIVFGN